MWRRRLWILVAFVVGAVVAYGYSSSRPAVFTARSELLRTDALVNATGSGPSEDASRLVSNEARVLQSQAVLADAASRVQRSFTDVTANVTVQPSSDNDTITIAARGRTARAAADLANAITAAYVAIGARQARADADAARRQASVEQANITQELNTLPATRPPGAAASAVINAERQALLAQLSAVTARLSQLKASADAYTPALDVIRAATAPGAPTTPRPKRDALLAGMMAALVTGALLWFVDTRQPRQRPEDRVAAILEVPALGSLRTDEMEAASAPSPPGRRSDPTAIIDFLSAVAGRHAGSGSGAAFTITTLGEHPRLDAIMMQLADAAGADGQRALVVDARTLSAAAGTASDRRQPLRRQIDAALEQIEEEAAASDIVLVAAPPVLSSAVVRALSRATQGVVLVVPAATSAQDLRLARLALGDADPPLLGFILVVEPGRRRQFVARQRESEAARERGGADTAHVEPTTPAARTLNAVNGTEPSSHEFPLRVVNVRHRRRAAE